MTGTEFLARAAAIDPKTVRIMVTAYGDAATLQDAINNGSIYRFIPKPWNPDDVRATLIRGIEAYALERERSQLLNELTVLNRVSARSRESSSSTGCSRCCSERCAKTSATTAPTCCSRRTQRAERSSG